MVTWNGNLELDLGLEREMKSVSGSVVQNKVANDKDKEKNIDKQSGGLSQNGAG